MVKQVNVVFSADDNYVPHLSVSILSLLSHASIEFYYNIVIIDGGISFENQTKLKTLFDAVFYGKKDHFNVSFVEAALEGDVYTRAHFTPSIYHRLFAPDLLPHLDRVLYLDSDVLILQDVSALFFEDLDGFSIGACSIPGTILRYVDRLRDRTSPYNKMSMGDYISNILAVKNPEMYFNSGVLLFDLKKMRDKKTFRDGLLDLSKQKLYFPDQDFLNSIFFNDVKMLSSQWNFASNFSNPGGRDPFIVHYIQKPWKNLKTPFSSLYFQYLRQTPWYEAVLFDIFEIERVRRGRARRYDYALSVWHRFPSWFRAALKKISSAIGRALHE